MNNNVVILPYTQHNFSSMKYHLWGRLQRVILSNSFCFALKMVIQYFFFFVDISLKQDISWPWKGICRFVIFKGPKIYNQHTNTWNRQMFIPIQKRFTMFIKIRIWKTREIGSGTKLFITFLSLRFFDMRRKTQFLQQTHSTFCRPQLVSPRRYKKSTTFL